MPAISPRPTKRVLALASAIAAAGGLSACGGGVPSDSVASVDGKSITKAALKHWVGVLATQAAGATAGQASPAVPEPPNYTACVAHLKAIEPKPVKGQQPKTEAALKAQCEQQYGALKTEALGFLISVDWVLGEAEERGVKLSDAEVTKQLNENRSQQYPQEAAFQKYLAQIGQTVSDALLRTKFGKLSSDLQERATAGAAHVSQAEIANYYNEHPSQYGHPESRDVRLVLTNSEAQARQARREIESGRSFQSVARSKSVDPVSRKSGGVVSGVARGQLEKPLEEALFAAKQGVLTGPVKTQFGYYVFEVTKTHPASQQTLAQEQSSVQQLLISERRQQELKEYAKEFEQRWRARTDCRAGYVMLNCKQYKSVGATSEGTEGTEGAQTGQTIQVPPAKGHSRKAGKK